MHARPAGLPSVGSFAAQLSPIAPPRADARALCWEVSISSVWQIQELVRHYTAEISPCFSPLPPPSVLFHPLSPGVRYSSHLEIPPDAAVMLCQPKMLKPGYYLLTGTLAGVSQELALRNTSKTPPLALPGVKHPSGTAGPNPH